MNTTLSKILSTLLLFLTVGGCTEKQSDSQWSKLPAPMAAQISCFTESSDGTFYAGSSDLYKSIDRGESWEILDFKDNPLEMMETEKGSLLVGTYRGGIFRSTDKGESWDNVGFENNVYIFKITQVANGRIFAAATFLSSNASNKDSAGVFVSDDDGLTWESTSVSKENIKGVFNPKGEMIFASGTGMNSFYRSLDNGASWSNEVSGLPDSIPVSAIVELEGAMFAAVGDPQDAARTIGGGIYKSEDDGLTWVRSQEGLAENTKVSDISVLEGRLFVSTGYQVRVGDRGVFRSDDLGQTWKAAGLNDLHLRLLNTTSDKHLVVGSNVSSLFISEDGGGSWMQTGKEFENWPLFQILENEKYLFTSGESGIWRAKLPVKKWENIKREVGSLVKLSNSNLLMAENGEILKTEDNGETWEPIAQLDAEMIFLDEVDSDLLIACAQADGMYFSTDNGHYWTKYDVGDFARYRFRTAFKTSGGALLIGSSGGILRSPDLGQTWHKVDDDFQVWSFVELDDTIYAGGYAKGVHISTNDGQSWTSFNVGIKEDDAYLTVTSLCTTSDQSIICGTLGEGTYILNSKDSLWREFKTGLSDFVNFGIVQAENGKLYTTSERGVFERN